MSVKLTIKQSKAFHCLDCGKCTSVCPVSAFDAEFSPRRTVYHTVTAIDTGALPADELNLCLTCGRCHMVCPANVDYMGFTQGMRCNLEAGEEHIQCSHGGVMQNLMRIMAKNGSSMNRLDWVPDDARTAAEGELLYFTGCLPFYDAYFTHLEMDTVKIARDTLRLINAAGETPVLMADELCCGHDLYWSGDEENTKRLAEKNSAAIAASGAKRVVTACPECAFTLKELYPRLTGKQPSYEVMHIAQYLEEKRNDGDLKLTGRDSAVTFHDSCRLSRQLDVTEAPRTTLREIFGEELHEMEHHGKNAFCCGTNGWLHCNSTSRQIQDSRLREAADAGAETLITACPKCQIHLRCAQASEDDETLKRLEVRDLVSVVAEAIDGG